MSYEYILVEKVDGVGILTLNRPEVLNAMNHGLSSELHDAVETLNSDDEIGCIVITGSGRRAFPPEAISTSNASTLRSLQTRNGAGTATFGLCTRIIFPPLPSQ
jgi:hypothetical protein